MKKYKVFKFTDRNSGHYVRQDLSLAHARGIAKNLSQIGAKKAQVEGENGFFETYENFEKTSWSA